MAEREQVNKKKSTKEQAVESDESGAQGAEKGEKLKAEMDDLLDEIDDVLETNAEEFVKSYVQKGGE